MSDQLLITVEQSAQRLGIGRSLAFELVSSGQVRSVKIGRRRLIVVESLREYVNGLQAQQGAAPAA